MGYCILFFGKVHLFATLSSITCILCFVPVILTIQNHANRISNIHDAINIYLVIYSAVSLRGGRYK